MSDLAPETEWTSACGVGTCLEVKHANGQTFIRDNAKPDVVLQVPDDSWKTFVTGVKEGVFDR